MSGWEIVLGVVAGLVVNELTEMSPWLARRLVTWSAHHRYEDPERAALRAEELTALIDHRPGKLFKLVTGMSFAASAVVAVAGRRTDRRAASAMPWQAGLYLAVVLVSSGALVGHIVLSGLASVTGSWGLLLVLGLLFVVCDSIPTWFRTQEFLASLSFLAVLITVTLVGPEGAALVGLTGALKVRHGHPLRKRLFNGAQFAIGGYAAGWVYQALGGGTGMPRLNDLYGFVTPYAAATAVFIAVNLMFTLVMIRLASGPGILTTAQLGGLSRFAVAYLGCGVLGLFTAGLWATFGPYSLVLLLAPSMVIPLVHRTPRRLGSGG
ncbi:hypothetical protein ACTMTF_08605 [Nonomuraea sp. ZG12]|uniref:hypothetical protein n=1 Tax=Nonomuraea sp. ZG12 TaxID=3452207 RepID=UPI003F8C434B